MSWWEFLSGFEVPFENEWEQDIAGWGYSRTDEDKHDGTYCAKSINANGGLIHTILCEPDDFYTFRMWFKIVGDVPTGGSSGVLLGFFLNDIYENEIQLYIATGTNPPYNPYLYLVDIDNYEKGDKSITVGEWHLLRVRIEVKKLTAYAYVWLDDLDTPLITMPIYGDCSSVYPTKFKIYQFGWFFGEYNTPIYLDGVITACDGDGAFPEEEEEKPPMSPNQRFQLLIGGSERCYEKIHYVKNHPSPDPDTIEITASSECIDEDGIDWFDAIELNKDGVTEWYGFVEEVVPRINEDGFDYYITGRCWKLIPWKKYTERFIESREIGPTDSEGNLETGFFGNVYPHELIKFLLRCPVSDHPKGKIRHKFGWGIASDFWRCCANETADTYYPDIVGLRYTELSWRGRGEIDSLHIADLICDGFDSTYDDWTEFGTPPYLDTDSETDRISISFPCSNQREGYFSFDDLVGTANTIYYVKLYVKAMKQRGTVWVYLNDGTTDHLVGILQDSPFSNVYNIFDVTNILDTPTKVNSAKIYFKATAVNDTGWASVIYSYLKVQYSTTDDNPIYQQNGDWFVVDLGGSYEDVMGILVECRRNPNMYSRNYNIQYATISNCCEEGDNDAYWNDFSPAVNVTNNTARDVLHSWIPQDSVRGIRIKITANSDYPWEISQIYIWQSDAKKYRLLNEGD